MVIELWDTVFATAPDGVNATTVDLPPRRIDEARSSYLPWQTAAQPCIAWASKYLDASSRCDTLVGLRCRS